MASDIRCAPAARRAITRMIMLCAAAALDAAADEGMWALHQPPLRALQAKYQFEPAPGWLDTLRAASLQVSGASGSFVSSRGLVLTNHHVAMSCLQKLSTPEHDLVRDGFMAASAAEERLCPGFEIKRLESSEDVTAAVQAAVRSRQPAAANGERNAAIARIENACGAADGLRCEMETLYRGAAYRLHRYRVWKDVRLVFAPEASVGFFGGDTDNFVYPRFDLDVAFLRVYQDGAPVAPGQFLRWTTRGVRDGDLVFAVGHPYETGRLITLAQLELDRDVLYPLMMTSAERHRRNLQQFGARSPEAARRAADNLFGTENWLKAMRGEYRALQEPALFAKKKADEAQLRKAYARAGAAADPWTRVSVAARQRAAAFRETWSVGYGFRTLFEMAGRIVELAYERRLPDGERLAEYRDTSMERILHRVTADAPVYKDLEQARLASYWAESRDLLGPAHPFVRRVLDGRSPEDSAARVIAGTRLDEMQERRKLVEGGIEAVEASTDPLIVLARAVYPMRRRLARSEEVEFDEPVRQAGDEIDRVRVRVLGRDAYPDATGFLCLSYGRVQGYDTDGVPVPAMTNYWGLFARHAAFDGKAPFDLPPRWTAAQRDLRLGTPLDFVSTLDIIGGNSGSPVVNRDLEVVGLVFDGNLESLGARFAYTEQKARAIAVDARGIAEALDHVYHATSLLQEIGAAH